MHGNVWQLCDQSRIRGGSFASDDTSCQAGLNNIQQGQAERTNQVGFRLVRVNKSAEKQRPEEFVPNKTETAPAKSPAEILEQARAHASRREWKEAARSYAEVIDRPSPDWGEAAFEYAAVLLLASDRAAYKEVCRKLVERSGQPGVRSYHVARACSLSADPFAPAERPGELAKEELETNATAFWSLWLQGALQHRGGRYKEALSLLQKSQEDKGHPPDGVAGVRMWMALTYHKLDQAQQARHEFEKAEQWLANYPAGMPPEAERSKLGLHLHNWLEVHVLGLEVTTLLRPSRPGE
jgi:tetratricopeptide (TPR) repeat protein